MHDVSERLCTSQSIDQDGHGCNIYKRKELSNLIDCTDYHESPRPVNVDMTWRVKKTVQITAVHGICGGYFYSPFLVSFSQ